MRWQRCWYGEMIIFSSFSMSGANLQHELSGDEASSYKEKRSQSGRVCIDNHRVREQESRVVQPLQSKSSTRWLSMIFLLRHIPSISLYSYLKVSSRNFLWRLFSHFLCGFCFPPQSASVQAVWRSQGPMWPAPSSVTPRPKHHIRHPRAVFRKKPRVLSDVFWRFRFVFQMNEWNGEGMDG